MSFNPHTHAGCDSVFDSVQFDQLVSIHTPTQGVTVNDTNLQINREFQSTHPRRV